MYHRRKKRYYAGIGSRETPESIRPLIDRIVLELKMRRYVLRSGGAEGADTFFEDAVGDGEKEIFLPWKGFCNRVVPREYQSPSNAARELAAKEISGYLERNAGAQKLLARNMHQVLGLNLDSPVKVIICWTEGGKMKGGTAHAMRLGKSRNIPVYNLAKDDDIDKLLERLNIAPQQKLF